MKRRAIEERPVIRIPSFLRRQLGLRARSQFPLDDLVRVRVGSNAFMLTDVKDVRHVLVTNADNYVKTPRLSGPSGKRRAGSGLLTSSGAAHRRQRRLMQPVFHQRIIDGFAGVVADRTERMLRSWQNAPEVDVRREMSDLALAVLFGVVFGIDFADESGALAQAVRTRRRFTEYLYHSHLPLRERLPMRVVRENRKAVATLDRAIHGAIDARRRNGFSSADLISLLMSAEYPDGSRMTESQVRDEALTLTSTGHETIGDALAWTWYLLGRHREVERRLATEVDQVLGDRPPRAGDVARLDYTASVLSESLRLYPPTWIYVRVPIADDVLPSGHSVRSGWTLYLSPYLLHRHPRYFPEPERFDPDRFRTGSGPELSKFAYLPFGVGPHTCIGEAFARLEGTLVLAQVAQRFWLELLSEDEVVPSAGITLYPKSGIRVRPVERKRQA